MDPTAPATCDLDAMLAAAGLSADIAFGIVYVRKQPATGIGIPGTIKVNIPLVKWQGFMAIIVEGKVQVWIKAEV